MIGQPVSGPLDQGWFDRIGTYGPSLGSGSNLAVAAAQNDEKVAEAQLRLARSQRVPDVTVNAGLRRVPISNGTAAVLGVSVPL
ncbi:TolC family protein, partial [Acinetobacter baumannii]